MSDITLYIVIPTRRSFASATQILVSHAFGDAISPYLIGAIADYVNSVISHDIPPNHIMSSDNNSFTAGGNQSNMSFPTISPSLNDVSVEVNMC